MMLIGKINKIINWRKSFKKTSFLYRWPLKMYNCKNASSVFNIFVLDTYTYNIIWECVHQDTDHDLVEIIKKKLNWTTTNLTNRSKADHLYYTSRKFKASSSIYNLTLQFMNVFDWIITKPNGNYSHLLLLVNKK